MYIFKSPSLLPVSLQALDSAAVINRYLVAQQQEVSRLAFAISTSVVSTGDVVVTFKRRPTLGSSSGEVSLGTLTMPNGAAAGKIYYKDIDPVVCAEGEEIICEVTTAAAGMSAAGNGQGYVVSNEDPEESANNSDLVESA